MGASGWQYIEPYGGDLVAALGALHQREFHLLVAQGDAVDEESGEPLASIEELWEQEYFEEEGTHSVVDVRRIIAADEYDDFGTVRPLTDDECRELFGTARPTRADFRRAQEEYARRPPHDGDGLWGMDRWSAWCTPLHDDRGAAAEVAFWGISGD